MTRTILVLFSVAVLLGGCAPIQHYKKFEGPVGTVQTSPVGMPVYTIRKTSDLPNAYGKADIWGGKVDNGWTRLVYLGKTADGKAAFHLENMEIQTNETRLQRYRPLMAVAGALNAATVRHNYSGSSIGNTFSANGTSTVSINPALALAVATPDTQTAIVPAGTGQFATDKRILNLGDVTVEILGYDEASITYKLTQSK